MQNRGWLFRAMDFQSLMYPCFTFCRILGIFPYKINDSTFETSKSRYILSTIVISVQCVSLIVVYKLDISKNLKLNFGVATGIIQETFYYILSIFIAIATQVLSSPRMSLLQKIMEISSRLPTKSYQKLSRLIHAKDIFGFFFVTGLMCIWCFKLRYSVFDAIVSIYINLLVFQINMLYMNCVCLLKACFKGINDELLHMQKLIVNNEQRTPLSIYYEQRKPFLIMELKNLQKQHLMISDAVQTLNIVFSLQLLATIVLVFSQITLSLYLSEVQWHDGVSISLNNEFSQLVLMSVAYYITKITLLVWACETGKNQAQEIKTTIHDVLNSTSDEQIKDELQLFSLQTLHCRNVFFAKGLTVDATLLAAMVGSITTYMLILMQFLITSHSCDEKSATNITYII